MAKVIGLIQVKGGAGRSTLATNLAGHFANRGPTLLVDCDMPQGTSASWAAMRIANPPPVTGARNLTPATAGNHGELLKVIEAEQDRQDFIVLDGPPRIAEMTRAILLLSDLALIPIGASAAEVWATADMLPIIEEAQSIKADVKPRIVWMRYRDYVRSAGEIAGASKRELGLPALKTTLGFRVAYSDALAMGCTAAEMPTRDGKAKQEIFSLMDEVTRLLR